MSASELARNRWPGILKHFGVDERLLSDKHSPCPVCSGRDRFRFDDQEGRGTFYCSHCGAGDGFKLLMIFKGWGFKEAADAVEGIVGTLPANLPSKAFAPSNDFTRRLMRRLWRDESRPVVEDDPVTLYLRRRIGEIAIPATIRFHPALDYHHDDDVRVTKHPAMLAKVQASDGKGVALHRTYLTSDGHKADVPIQKKILGSLPPASAVRLFEPAPCLGIAEGIETALAAFVRFGVPTWAATSANGLEKWSPPEGVHRVVVFGDNDVSVTGQAAAYNLAKRLRRAGIEVEVRIPEQPESDWAD